MTIAFLRLLCRCAEIEMLLSTLQQSEHLLDGSVGKSLLFFIPLPLFLHSYPYSNINAFSIFFWTSNLSLELLRQLALLDGSESSGQHRSRLSKVQPSGTEPQHPTFGMKRDLVQLIGNLSFQCPSCQNRVRKLGGIHLVLNQCSIDHYNPCILITYINYVCMHYYEYQCEHIRSKHSWYLMLSWKFSPGENFCHFHHLLSLAKFLSEFLSCLHRGYGSLYRIGKFYFTEYFQNKGSCMALAKFLSSEIFGYMVY